MSENDFSFEIINDDGMQVKCDTLLLITPEIGENIDEDTYIIYTDYTMDDKNNFNVFISKLVKSGDDFKLEKAADYEKYTRLVEAMKNEYAKLNATEVN